MRLESLVLKNFRGYRNEKINFSDFTTFVGINDVGKSTVFEALDIFFGNSKMDRDDRNIKCGDEDVELTATFSELPDKIQLEDVDTSFSDEFLVNDKNFLEIKQVYSGPGLKLNEYIVANIPTDPLVQDIHTMKISELRTKFKNEIEDIDKRVSSQIRKRVLEDAFERNHNLIKKDIVLKGTGATKDITHAVHNILPLYQLFKSDRRNTDSDSEIQDPINAIVKTAIAENPEIREQLNTVYDDVNVAVEKTIQSTLKMLQGMNAGLAKEMKVQFQDPKWSSVFKFSLDTDSDVPLNKRGSGIRRLILLNFFRAEAKKKMETIQKNQEKNVNIIYAFEEPETSQHPRYQQMLIDSFKEMTSSSYVQVMCTTHSPAIAKIVPENGVRLIKKEPDRGAYSVVGKDALDEVVQELGIISNVKLYPDQIRKAVLVEGPDDEAFFRNVYKQLSKRNDESVIFVSGGGMTITDVLNQRFIQSLNLNQKIVIVDGDEAGSQDIKKMKDKISDNDNVQLLKLKKATIEFYLPYHSVEGILSHNKDIKLEVDEQTWLEGRDEDKLSKGQKRALKRGNIYSLFNVNDLDETIKLELQEIVNDIDW